MSVKAYISDFAKRIIREAEETEVITRDIKKVVQAVIDGLKGTENDEQILSQINRALLDYASTNPEVSLDLAKKIFADMAMSKEWDELAVETDDEQDELLEEEQDEYPEWMTKDLDKAIRKTFYNIDLSDIVAVSQALADVMAKAKGINDTLEEPFAENEWMEFVKQQIAKLITPEAKPMAKPMAEFRTKGTMKKRLRKESTEATSAGSDKLPQSVKAEISKAVVQIVDFNRDSDTEDIYSAIVEWMEGWLRENDYSRSPVVEYIDEILKQMGIDSENESLPNNESSPSNEEYAEESAIYRIYRKSASYFAE